MSHKIGVVGDKDSIMAFKMLGFDVFFASKAQEARELVDDLAKQDYGIIFLTEQLAVQIPETVIRYDERLTPAVILIPNRMGTNDYGHNRFKDNVERAVGINIL